MFRKTVLSVFLYHTHISHCTFKQTTSKIIIRFIVQEVHDPTKNPFTSRVTRVKDSSCRNHVWSSESFLHTPAAEHDSKSLWTPAFTLIYRRTCLFLSFTTQITWLFRHHLSLLLTVRLYEPQIRMKTHLIQTKTWASSVSRIKSWFIMRTVEFSDAVRLHNIHYDSSMSDIQIQSIKSRIKHFKCIWTRSLLNPKDFEHFDSRPSDALNNKSGTGRDAGLK